MYILFGIWWMISIPGLIVLKSKERFEKSALLGQLAAVFVLYLFSFFHQMRLGFYVTCLFGAGFWILLGKDLLQKKDLKEFWRRMLTPGFFVYIVLLIYLAILYHNKGFDNCDEFMHWGPMVLESLRHDGFYIVGDVLHTHNDYPPFMTLQKLLWCGFNGFKYSEPVLYTGQVSFQLACLLPLFSKYELKKKDILKAAVLGFFVLLIGCWVSMTETAQEWAFAYNSIYLDWVIVVLAASIFFLYHFEGFSFFNDILYALGLSALLLSKQICIAYYLIIGFYMILTVFLKKDTKQIRTLIILAVIPLLFYLSWSILIRISGWHGQFVVSDISLSDLLKQCVTPGSYARTIARTFLIALLTRPMSYYPIPMSYFVVILVVCIAIWLINKKNLPFVCCIIIGALGYAFTVMLLYMTTFSPEEAARLASFDRYINSYLFFAVLLLFAVSVHKLQEKTYPWYIYLISVLVFCFSIERNSLFYLLPKAELEQRTSDVLVIDYFDTFFQEREEVSGLTFRYHSSETGHKEMTREDFYEEAKKNIFLYVQDYDGNFIEKYWPTGEGQQDPYKGIIYHIVVQEDGSIRFDPLYNSYMQMVVNYYVIHKN